MVLGCVQLPERKTQIVIDGTVVLKEGAEFTCGPKTDIVFVEKDGIKVTDKTYKHDASAIVLDGGSMVCGAGSIMRGDSDYHLCKVGTTRLLAFSALKWLMMPKVMCTY